MIGVHSLLQTESIVQQGVMVTSQTGFGDPISWMFVVIGFYHMVFEKRIEDIETKSIQYDELVMVQAEFSGQTIRAKGLVDSGNQLYDPLTKTPVMILALTNSLRFSAKRKRTSSNPPVRLK